MDNIYIVMGVNTRPQTTIKPPPKYTALLQRLSDGSIAFNASPMESRYVAHSTTITVDIARICVWVSSLVTIERAKKQKKRRT